MQVKEVMTKDVLVVFEDTSFKEIAELIERHRVSAVPVLHHQGPVGVVSQADLLPNADHERRPKAHRFQARPGGGREHKAQAPTARDLMTSPAIVIGPEATVSQAAARMREHQVKRLPVVDAAGKLVGIVSRGDLLKVFIRGDELIKQEIESRVLERTMLLSPGKVRVRVDDGVVRLEGQVDQPSEVSLLARLIAEVDGVVTVENKVGYHRDGSGDSLDLWAGGLVLPPW